MTRRRAGKAKSRAKSKARTKAPPKVREDQVVIEDEDDMDGEDDDLPDDVDLKHLYKLVYKLKAERRYQPCSDEEFRAMVEHLKTVCPPPKRCKVKVRRVPREEMEHEYGYVTKVRDRFEVILDRAMTEYETLHVLLHEWAHMLAWQPYHPLMGDHSAHWGVWYSLVWRKYHGVE